MANETTGDVGGTIDPKSMPGLRADRTTAEVVADIVAENPAKHGVTLEERKRRAAEQAKAEVEADKAFFDEPDEQQ